jgi:TP901 family phage tail tape measure protein
MTMVSHIAIGLSANVANFVQNMASASKAFEKFHFATKKARANLSAGFSKMKSFGLYAGAAFGYAINSAAEFQKGMAEVSTIVTDSSISMSNLNAEVLALSKETGKGPAELAHGLYQTISSGVEASDAMSHLALSTKAAIAGVAQVSETVDLSTNVVNAYGKGVYSLAKIFDVAFKAVELGKTTFPELASQIGTVLPFASQLEVSLEDLFAATATLTKGGINTAEATTYLKNVMASVITPTSDAAAAAKSLGIEFSASAIKAKGFLPFLQDIQKKTGGNIEAMSRLFPNIRSVTAVLALAGKQSQEFADIQDKLVNSSGALAVAFGKMEASDAEKYVKMLNELRINTIEIGLKALPILLKVVNYFKEFYGTYPLLVEFTAAMIILNRSGIIPMSVGVYQLYGKLPVLISGLKAWAAAQTLVSAATATTVTYMATLTLIALQWITAAAAVGLAFGYISYWIFDAIGLTQKLADNFRLLGEKVEWFGRWSGTFTKEKTTAETKGSMQDAWKNQLNSGQITAAEYDRRISSIATSGTSGQRNAAKSPQIDQTNKTLEQIRDRLGPARAA